MLPGFDDQLRTVLDELQGSNRYRSCPEIVSRSHVSIRLADSLPLVSFSSNDYLGLSIHPAVLQAAATTLSGGLSAGASRLVSGDHPAHRDLEYNLAQYLGRPAALLFPTGYQANLGVLTALLGPGDVVVSDALNHASLIDGCRLSKADIVVYPHADVQAAELALTNVDPNRRKLLVTESVFSMDGDVAPVRRLSEVCQKAGAAFVVDEAHALGLLGPGGRGICAQERVQPDVLIGTLGKAFGASGGFVVGSQILRAYLVNRARTFIYTTGLPPAIAAAAAQALRIINSAEGEDLRGMLASRVSQLHRGLEMIGPSTPIVPWVLGTDVAALAASSALRAAGLFVQAIRPPTVPEGTARLRITLSSKHTADNVQRLLQAIGHLEVCAPHLVEKPRK